jgi:hypothetical protein
LAKKRSIDWIIQLLKNVGYIKWMGYYPETGIVEIVIAGRVAIDAPILEAMKKSSLILDGFFNSTAPEYIDSLGEFLSDVHEEHHVPEFVCTTLRLKHKELPPLESSDTEKLRRDPLEAEYVAAVCDSARSSCPADTDDQQGDEDDDE